MIKLLIVGRRAPGLTRFAAQRHLREVHGRMVVLPPADAGAMPAYYAQNHVVDGAYPAGAGPCAIERDLVTELHFESFAAMQASVTTPYYLENLRPDEPRFVDDATVARLVVEAHPILEGSRTTAKLFLFLSKADGGEEEWQAVRAATAETATAWPGIVALVENVVAQPPQGERFVDSVFEAWFGDTDLALAAAADATALVAGNGIDQTRSLVIVADEFTEERLRALLA